MPEPGSNHADREAARRAWLAARSFADLCELGGAFLEGGCAHFPGWGAPDPDVETDAIRAPLVALHRLGVLTVASQPAFEGLREGRATRQRAFFAGFAREDVARSLLGARAVVVRAWFADGTSQSVGTDCEDAEAMTTEDGVARVVAGHAARDDELALFEGEIGAAALSDLRDAAYVTAWDPTFGRTQHLWDECVRLASC